MGATIASSRRMRLLVVDDEPQICQLITDALQNDKIEVVSAISGQAAIEISKQIKPALVIVDIRLGDLNGLEVIDRLRKDSPDLPAVIITGWGDTDTLLQASRRRPIGVLPKPINLARLKQTVDDEIRRLEGQSRFNRRYRYLRELNKKRRHQYRLVCATCAELSNTCRDLQEKLVRQTAVIEYNKYLLECSDEHDIFRGLFRLFVERTGPLFGVAMLCDETAELRLTGRFGVPVPDGINFCRALADAIVPDVLEKPEIKVFDAYENLEKFPESIHKFLIGVTLLVIPLMVGKGQLIGIVTLYRKGEQPFTQEDLALADMIAPTTAAAVQKT